jgi:hypothetical protein
MAAQKNVGNEIALCGMPQERLAARSTTEPGLVPANTAAAALAACRRLE